MSNCLALPLNIHYQSCLQNCMTCYASSIILHHFYLDMSFIFHRKKSSHEQGYHSRTESFVFLVSLKFLYAAVPTIHHVQIQITVKCH
jgi:hypothetical protein